MKLILLTKGKQAIVDDDVYEYLMKWKWYACKDKHTYYAVRSENTGGDRTVEYRGKRYTLQELARETGIKHHTLYSRLFSYRWPIDRALSLPPHYGNRYAV